MLELKNIIKTIIRALSTNSACFENFNLTIQDGEFVSVVGSNGSGKTSMLNIICGTIPVDSGSILVQWNRHRQSERLYPSQKDRKSVSGSIQRNLSKHDHS